MIDGIDTYNHYYRNRHRYRHHQHHRRHHYNRNYHRNQVLQIELDRESQDTHLYKVLAFDGGNPPRTGSCDVTVVVTDANDNPPTFERATYEASLIENSPMGTTVLRVYASDRWVAIGWR